jgi:hypothetical protein
MSDSTLTPTELASLLDFTPVLRKVKRPDGWTPELQRRFIRLLAESGSPQAACTAMQKHVTGIEALYKVPSADSFRAAWDQALAIGRRRLGLDCGPPHLGPVPGIARRPQRGQTPPPPEPEPEQEQDDTAFRMELVERLVAKWQRKVGQEREARLAGEVVSADFYLRQITALEVAFDLMIDGQGDRGWTMLMEARRGTRNMLEIADTYMARVLDQARRDHWAAMDEPGRPLLWPERYLIGSRAGDVRTEPMENLGKCSRPAAGIDPEAWHLMSTEEQRRIYDEQHKRDAAEQIEWERSAHEAWEASEHGARAREAWEASEHGAASTQSAPVPREDFADRAMREALAAARKEYPDDFDE